MAVAYVSDVDKTPATGTSIAYTSFAVSGTNPVILVLIALDDSARTTTVSSLAVSAGLSAGTPVEVKAYRIASPYDTYVSIWAIPAPTGTGTITATLSASVPWQSNAILMQGAHQTTPCPAADAVGAEGDTPSPLVVTPANLTANDAAVGMGANAIGGDAPVFQQTETFNDNTTNVNACGGYHLGTGSISVLWGSPTVAGILVGVRVAAAAGGRTTKNTRSAPLGMEVGMNFGGSL